MKLLMRVLRNPSGALQRLRIATRISYYSVEAWDLLARGQIEEAESLIDKVEFDTSGLPSEHFVMRAHIKHRARKYHEAKNLFDDAWLRIVKDKDLTDNEKLYLCGYIMDTAASALDLVRFWNPSEPDYQFVTAFDIHDIDLQKVPNHMKRNFPMRNHRDWRVHGKEN